jgi:hypothetical protein
MLVQRMGCVLILQLGLALPTSTAENCPVSQRHRMLVSWPCNSSRHVNVNSFLHFLAMRAQLYGCNSFSSLAVGAQVTANNMQLALPHMTWALSPAVSAPLQSLQQQQALHQMWEMLTAALGYNTPIDPHVAASMLLSAAAVGGSSSSAIPRQSEQVRIHTTPLQYA